MNLFIYMHCSQTIPPTDLVTRSPSRFPVPLTTSTAEYTTATESHTTFWRGQQFRILQQFVFRFNDTCHPRKPIATGRYMYLAKHVNPPALYNGNVMFKTLKKV
jgi:hypothetical protein